MGFQVSTIQKQMGSLENAELTRIAQYIKLSKDSFRLGLESDDYIKELITAQIHGYVAEMAKEEGEITVYIERPSFFDWLLRRTKEKRVKYKISQLAKIDKLKLADNIRVIQIPVQYDED